MQFSIKNVSLLKEKLEKISNLVLEVAVKFRRDYIKIYGMDPANIIAIELLFPKKSPWG